MTILNIMKKEAERAEEDRRVVKENSEILKETAESVKVMKEESLAEILTAVKVNKDAIQQNKDDIIDLTVETTDLSNTIIRYIKKT